MTYLLPGERLDGTVAERAHLRRLLVSFRTDPPPMRLPDVSGCPLLELLDSGTMDSLVRPGKSGGCYVCEPAFSLPDTSAL
jgi:hypothetical protein